MAVSLKVEPFEAETYTDWQDDKHYLILSFFGTEIFKLEIKEPYMSEYELDDAVETAKQELGALLSERLAARITAGNYCGIDVKRIDNGA